MIKTVKKTWGWEEWLANVLEDGFGYCLKKLFVEAGKFCSFHYHRDKDETFYVEYGEVEIQHLYDENNIFDNLYEYKEDYQDKIDALLGKPETTVLTHGDSMRIIPYTAHTFLAKRNSLILEVSTFHRDEDSYRLKDGCKGYC